MRSEPVTYRPDIDGWRAVAVGAVVAHHFDKTWLPGGYLGVDMFFVISGFVITLSLLSRKSETFASFLAEFYARRVRRLLPALVACVLVTSIAVWFVDPAPRQSIGTGIAALFGVSNILLTLQDVDYFSRSTELNAFTHTWSLGVEEHFYLFFPLLLWFCVKRRPQDARGMRNFIVVLEATMAASCLLFVLTAKTFPVFNYYQLPTRFWELAAGALTCLASRRMGKRSFGLAPPGAALILAIAFVLPIEQRITGTLLAVCATMILLATTPACHVLRVGLEHKGLRFLGRISYPLYLWHWSVLVISRFTIGISPATAPFQLAVMLGLAWATYRFVETPVRIGVAFRANRTVLLAGLCLALASTAFLVTLMNKRTFGPIASAAFESIPPAFLPLAGSGADFLRVCAVDGGKRLRRDDTIDKCTAPPLTPDGNTIWTFGDSHAGQLQPMLYAVREATGMGVHLIETPNTPFPFVGETIASIEGRKIFDIVSARFRPGDIVLLARLFLEREGTQRPLPDVAAWSAKAAALAHRLEARGVRLVVIGPMPMFRFDSVLSCVRSLVPSVCVAERAPLSAAVDAVTGQIQAAGDGQGRIVLFDPFATLCPAGAKTCAPFFEGRLVYRDKDHLNVLGSAALADPFIKRLGLPRR